MKWVEQARVPLPPKAVVMQVLPYQAASLVVYYVPGKSYHPQWFLARWDHQGPFTWELQCKALPQLLTVDNGLLIAKNPPNLYEKRFMPGLFAIRVDTGAELWQQDAPLRCAAVERGRVYTVEKQQRGPYRFVVRNAETGGLLRRGLSYDAYTQLDVVHDLVFGRFGQTLSVTTLDGEPLFEAEGLEYPHVVAEDGSLYLGRADAANGAHLVRWVPGSEALARVAVKPGLYTLSSLANPKHLVYLGAHKAKHLAVRCYDWSTKQERWSREVNCKAHVSVAALRETATGLLVSLHTQQHLLLDTFTGEERVVPLSFKGPMFASREVILLVKDQKLLAFSWR